MEQQLSGKRILVTGGTSFIGSHLVDALIGEKPSLIRIVDNLSSGRLENIQGHINARRVEFHKKDFLTPQRQIIGFTKKSKRIAKEILDILPKAPYQKIIPSKEAEMIKYFGNTFLATKVIFANQIYDLCQKLGIDYDIVKEVVSRDPRIGSSHLQIFHDGYRGYSGGCFPKDVKSLLQLVKKKKVDLEFLKIADKIHNTLIHR